MGPNRAAILDAIRRPAALGPNQGRRPTACLLTCVDERVVPEVVFRTVPGSLYCVRLAGHVVTPEVVSSIEIGIQLGCRLVFVMGHTDCGAVRLERAHTGDHFVIVQHIRWATRGLPWGAGLDEAIEANVLHCVAELRMKVRVRVEGGVLDVKSGELRVLEEGAGSGKFP